MSWIRKRFPVLVMLWIAGSFGMLALELLMTGHTEETQLLGVLASAAGALIALLAVFVPRLRVGWLVGFLVVGLFGLVGTALHWEEAGESDGAAYAAARYDDDEGEEGEGEEAAPPPLAPLGLTGLAALGGLALYARDEEAGEVG